jgi:hypothetical protein
MSVESTFLVVSGMNILMKIVCFVLGYLTIRLGYQLIASGAKGEFKFSTKFGGIKADLASVSPGLLFVLLGTMLIGYAISVEKITEYHKRVDPIVNEGPSTLVPNKLPFQDHKGGRDDEKQ